jgi:hypothetical protein
MKSNPLNRRTATGLAAVIFAASASLCVAYDANYKKSQCDAYSYHGLNERYVFGGDKGWIDNNVWDSTTTEGVDCSSYVPRCLAIPSFVGEHTAYTHPYNTDMFYARTVPNVTSTTQAGLLQWDFWVYREASGGPGNHMGLVHSTTSSSIVTREARGTDYGVVVVTRSKQSLTDWNTRYGKRNNWGAESTGKTARTVDNSSSGFSVTGTWTTASSAADKYGADYRYHSTAPVSEPAQWTTALNTSASWNVRAWWPAGSNRSATAPYIVTHAGGTTTVNVNQQANGGVWNLLGTWSMSGTVNVKLSCWTTTGFVVMADAIKWD